MSERIDHVAEARKWLEYSENLNPEVDWPRIAHASLLLTSHATLAGVEQQRIANLIALAGVPKIDGFENEVYDAGTAALMEGLLDFETVAAVPGYGPAGIDQRVFIRPDIREALGLS